MRIENMATDKPINIKILIFPSILAICAMVALTWFPPKIAQQEAVLSPTEIPDLNPTEVPDTIQKPTMTPISETEPVSIRGDLLELNIGKSKNNEENQSSHLTIEQHAL
jgi:hypothetical protein